MLPHSSSSSSMLNLPSAQAPSSRARISSRSLSSLDSVPEDTQSSLLDGPHFTSSRHPPTSYRLRKEERRPSSLGKGRADSEDPSSGHGDGKKRAKWVVDLEKTMTGSERWAESPRVILVLGDASPKLLAPLLYSPIFSNTLLLVGSERKQNSIEDLFIPTLEPKPIIHPKLQTFTLTKGSQSHSSPLPSLIAQATQIANQYRRSGNALRTRRSDSSDSSTSTTPPLTPPNRFRRLSGMIERRGSSTSMEQTDSSRSSMEFGVVDNVHKRQSTAGSESTIKPGMRSRLSMSFTGKPDEIPDFSSQVSPNQGPFDAIINLMPSVSSFDPTRALQDLLQQTVMTTTAIVTSQMTSRVPCTSPLTILHVLPGDISGPLPFVMESFLLSFLPSLKEKGSSNITGLAIASKAWTNVNVNPSRDEIRTGAEVLLFGGLNSPPAMESSGKPKPRAYLDDWRECVYPQQVGIMADVEKIVVNLEHPRQTRVPLENTPSPKSLPPPPTTTSSSSSNANTPIAMRYSSSSLARSPLTDIPSETIYPEPNTPDLQTSSTPSSVSSMLLRDPPSREGSWSDPPKKDSWGQSGVARDEKKGKRGVSGWFKSKVGIRA